MPHILTLDNVGLEFLLYRNKGLRLKEWLVHRLQFKSPDTVERFWVLRHLSLSFEEGDRIGVVGSNGAGKTTLLRLMAGVYGATEGRVEVHGRITPLLEMGTAFNPDLTGRENIFMNGAFFGHSKTQMLERIDRIIDFSGIQDFIDIELKYYSSGMQQRLAFAIATEVEPDILLVDEVFSAGDIEFISRATSRMTGIFKSARLVVFVSHSLGLIRENCTRTLLLHHGRILMDGPSDIVTEFYEAHPDLDKIEPGSVPNEYAVEVPS